MDIETLEQHRPVKTAIDRAANSVNQRINQLKMCPFSEVRRVETPTLIQTEFALNLNALLRLIQTKGL